MGVYVNGNVSISGDTEFGESDLVFAFDAGSRVCYPQTGSTWNDLSRTKLTGSFISGSSSSFRYEAGGTAVFDGTNYIMVSNNDVLNPKLGSFSVVTWVNTNPGAGGDGWDLWVSKRDDNFTAGYYIGVNNINGARFQVRDNNFNARNTAYIPYTANTWAMFTGIIDKKNNLQTIVRNNFAASASTTTLPGSIDGPNAFLSIGGDVRAPNFSKQFMVNGKIAVVLIYNTALSQSRIANIFNLTRGRFGV